MKVKELKRKEETENRLKKRKSRLEARAAFGWKRVRFCQGHEITITDLCDIFLPGFRRLQLRLSSRL
jgi:hypothetical protein